MKISISTNCHWIKCSDQKTQVGLQYKKKKATMNQEPLIFCVQETHFGAKTQSESKWTDKDTACEWKQ